jgi:peroxin-1
VDLSSIAEATEGYTGADLQALIYNANLEAVHTAMSLDPSTRTSREAEEEDKQVPYLVLGGHEQNGVGGRQKVVSRAEEAALQRRVSVDPFYMCILDVMKLFDSGRRFFLLM